MMSKKGVIRHPASLGQHLRNRQLILQLSQKEVASSLREVYDRWERDDRRPVVSEWPGILAFLGYYPALEASPADRVLKTRRCLKSDQKALIMSTLA